MPLLVGIVVSAIAGILPLKWLLKIMEKESSVGSRFIV